MEGVSGAAKSYVAACARMCDILLDTELLCLRELTRDHVLRHEQIKKLPEHVRAVLFMLTVGVHRDVIAAIAHMADWSDDHSSSVLRESIGIVQQAFKDEMLSPDPALEPNQAD